MSEFKFACPVCGQHIKCESDQAGTHLECPTCFQKVIVPQAPDSESSKFILTASQAQTRSTPQMSLPPSSVSPAPSGSGLSTAAAIVLVLICAAAGVFIAFRGRILGPGSKRAAITNAPASITNYAGQPGLLPGPQAMNNAGSSNFWTLDLTNVIIPDDIAIGRIRGTDFKCDLAVLQGGALTLRAGILGSPYLGFTINFFARRSEELAGKVLNVTTEDLIAPRVVLRSVDNGQPVNEVVRGGYAMKLEFGKIGGGKLPGKIYICLPDEEKSYVTGTFQAEIRDVPAAKPSAPKQGRPGQKKRNP